MLANTAVILAGGKSTRMGFDKQFIKINGKALIEHQIEVLGEVFGEIIVVTNRPEEYKGLRCRIAEDQLKDFGPLGGIHAGLKASSSLFSYFIACDMPNMNIHYINYLLGIAEKQQCKEAIVTRLGNWLEPFNAMYSKNLISSIEKAYISDNKRISSVVEASSVYFVEENTAREFCPDWSIFANINTIEDLENIRLKTI